MRTSFRAALYALLCSTVLSSAAMAQGGGLKLAYVNTQAVLQQAPGRAEAEKKFEAEMSGYQAQMKRMSDSLNAMIADFNKVQGTLNEQQREQRASAIRTRQAEYQQRAGQFEEQAQKRQMEYFQPIMQQIEKILGDIRREDGYSMIFDVAGSAAGIVAADSTLDITPKVIARLKAAPAPAAAAPARPAASGPVARPAGVTTRPTP
jgi:outer membrane protein